MCAAARRALGVLPLPDGIHAEAHPGRCRNDPVAGWTGRATDPTRPGMRLDDLMQSAAPIAPEDHVLRKTGSAPPQARGSAERESWVWTSARLAFQHLPPLLAKTHSSRAAPGRFPPPRPARGGSGILSHPPCGRGRSMRRNRSRAIRPAPKAPKPSPPDRQGRAHSVVRGAWPRRSTPLIRSTATSYERPAIQIANLPYR